MKRILIIIAIMAPGCNQIPEQQIKPTVSIEVTNQTEETAYLYIAGTRYTVAAGDGYEIFQIKPAAYDWVIFSQWKSKQVGYLQWVDWGSILIQKRISCRILGPRSCQWQSE